MAISTPAHLNTTADGVGSLTSKVSGSISPTITSGKLIAVLAQGAAGTTSFSGAAVSDTLANTGAWTVHVEVVGTATNRYGLVIASCDVTGATGSGTVTVTWTNASTRTVLSIVEVASGSALTAVQSKSNTGTATTLTVTLDSSPGASSLILAAVNSAGEADGITPDGAFSELADTSSTGGGNSRLQVQYDNGGADTTIDFASLATTNNVGGAIELVEGPTGPLAPDAPTIGTATAGNTTASAPWTDGSDGGSTILNHDLEIEKDGVSGTVVSDIGNTSPYGATGLTNGSDYRFRVRTSNAIGDSPWSAWSNEVTPTSPASSSAGGGRRGGGGFGRFGAMSRFGGGGSGSGGGSAGLVLPANLIRSQTLFEGFETAGDWTATAGSVASNTTAAEFRQGVRGIKLTSDGTGNATANKTISATFSAAGHFSVDVYVHDVAPASVAIMLSTDTGFTDGFQWTVSVANLGKNTFMLRKGDAALAGAPEWTDTFIRLRVSYGAGATSRSVTLDNLCRDVIGEPAYLPTFDDNHPGNITNVNPAFTARNMKATFFVNSGLVGTSGKASWDDQRTLRDAGHCMASHTDDHSNLNLLSAVDAQARIEAGIDGMVAQGLDSTQAHLFAYPFAPLPNATTLQATAAAGILLARTGTGNVSFPSWDPYRIPCFLASSASAATIEGHLDTAKREGKQIFTINHDVGGTISGSVDMLTTTLTTVLDYCIAQQIPVITFWDYYQLVVLGQSITIARQW